MSKPKPPRAMPAYVVTALMKEDRVTFWRQRFEPVDPATLPPGVAEAIKAHAAGTYRYNGVPRERRDLVEFTTGVGKRNVDDDLKAVGLAVSATSSYWRPEDLHPDLRDAWDDFEGGSSG